MRAWALIVCILAGAVVTSLRNFADPGAATQIVLITLGVLFAGGLLLRSTRFEVSIRDSDLVFRSRSMFGTLLKWPWTERHIPRRSVGAFWLDQNPSNEQGLTIRLTDGSSLRILGSHASTSPNAFESFVAAFRSFVGADSGSSVHEGSSVWRLPIHRVLAGGFVVACGAFMVLTVSGMMDQKSAIIVAIGGMMVAVQGVRFVLE